MNDVCLDCATAYPLSDPRTRCTCGGLLEVRAAWKPNPEAWAKRPLGVWRYREMLPLPEGAEPVTLGEGGTGLHATPRLGEDLGVADLRVKNEGENPTGSFKDRGMTCGVSFAKSMGHQIVGCASTGNTAASLAAYGARAGLDVVVIIPAGKIALGKLAQSIVYGAKVVAVRGNFDQALTAIDALAQSGDLYLLNSINPIRLEGQKTLIWEILDQSLEQTGQLPDRVVYPVGNAGNISAAHKGLVEWKEAGLIDKIPKLTGVQAAGAAPFARMMDSAATTLTPEPAPETIATAIRIGNPVSWPKARAAILQTGGTVTTVTDAQILKMQRQLASSEGIFVEPASAASLAGFKKLVADGTIKPSERVVCVTTGNGLKDPDAVLKAADTNVVEVEATPAGIRGALA